MDFNNIYAEYESITNTSRNSLDSINNLNAFYKSVHKFGELFYQNTRKAIETFFNEQIKIDTKSSLSKNLFEFYRNYEDYTIKIKHIINKLNKDIIDPIGLFHLNLSTIFTESLDEFKLICTSVIDAKKNLEKIKIKYYECCKLVQEQEKNVCKSFSGKILNNDEEINNAHDSLLKFRSQAENFAQLYKYELFKMNKILEENEKKYILLLDKLKTNEESRIFFIKCNMEKFAKIYEEFTISSFDFLNRLNTNLVEVKIEEDIKLYNEKFKVKENFLRFPKEEFIPYDMYKKSLETNNIPYDSNVNELQIENDDGSGNLNNFNTQVFSQSLTDSPVKSYSSQEKQDINTLNLNSNFNLLNSISDDFEIVHETQCYSEKYQQQLIENFLKQLFSENEIEVDAMGKLMEVLYNNQFFAKNLIDYVLRDRKNLYIKFLNFHNLQHFANILNTISLNLDNIQNENYDLNFAIIFIAERSFCLLKSEDSFPNKVYLSALLSKNKLYSTRSFWLDLIELKLSRRVEEQIRRLDRNLAEKSPSPANKSETANLFSNISSKLKNIFNNKERESGSSNGSTNSLNRSVIKNYEHASATKKNIIDKITINELCSIIKEYIPHFANFNFDISEAIDMIVELSTKYKISKEKISFFVTYLNSYVYTIKNKLPSSKEDIERKRSKSSSYLAKTHDYKTGILAGTIKYLNPLDCVNLTLLNKNCNSKLSKKLYKFILSKDISLKRRVKVWSSILKTKELKLRFNYQNILQEINFKKTNNDKNVSRIEEVIELDVQRTFFQNDVENCRSAIGNILKAIAYINPKINYCQGMNYIASFLFKITSNEEEAFYLMLGLFENTDFSLIFVEDLLRLKIFFYVFERLLSLYLPELYTYFKSNSIIVNYFCSPWFITLFTNTFNFVDPFETPIILLKIWDDFLLHGWKALMRSSIFLLKTHESYLITLKYEELLHFLINEMTKSGFFHNNNLSAFNNLLKSVKIKTELINNLENEYIQDIKIKEQDEKNKFILNK